MSQLLDQRMFQRALQFLYFCEGKWHPEATEESWSYEECERMLRHKVGMHLANERDPSYIDVLTYDFQLATEYLNDDLGWREVPPKEWYECMESNVNYEGE